MTIKLSKDKISVLATAFLLAVFLFLSPKVLAATFVDDTQAEFNAGTYSNTAWDTNHVELSSGQTSGTFTSQVFDGGTTANWSQLGWSETLTSVDKLIAVDVAADVWKSIDNAPTWSLVKDDYNSTDGNNATDLVIDGNKNVFILNNQAVWKSTDAGASWTKVSSDYNGAEGQNGVRIGQDGSNNLYISEADEDIWYSADSGANWTKKATNMNSGNGNAGGLVGVSSTLYLADAQSDIWKSTDSGANWTLVKDDYNGADGNGTGYMIASTAGNLYIVYNQAAWKSMDAGTSWTKITTDYNGSETQNAVVMAINSSGHLFIVEGDEDTWRSIDDGTNWVKQATNFNGGNGNIVGLGYIPVSTDLTFAARSGSANPPTDSFAGSLTDPTGGSPGVSSARYFQYRTIFSSEDGGVIPELASVTITYSLPDTTAPAAVSNLALSSPSNSAMTVSWTAPGDDGSTGTATSYDLRYSTSAITSGNFSSATQVSDEPTPSVAGTSQTMTVSGLSAVTTYYFAIKTSDEVPNTSSISNVVSLATTATPDTTAPAAVANLAASNASASTIDLAWTAPGDDASSGTATSYDIRYSTSNITTGNWASATQVSGEPTPQVAGTNQTLTVSGLSSGTTYYFAIKTSDEVPNESNLSNITSLATGAAEPAQPTNITIPNTGGGPSGGVQATTARFAGQAYPGSKIEVLRKDNINPQYTNIPLKFYEISPEGVFQVTLSALMQGEYFFALSAKDKDGRTTGTVPFSVNFISANSLVAEDIFLPPTVGLSKTVVSKGSDITVTGYSAPGSEIEIVFDSVNKAAVTSDKNGSYGLATSTTSLKLGEHNVKVRQKNQSGRYSDFSLTRVFRISQLASPKADFNGDDKVSIADWSIFLFRWAAKDPKLKQTVDLDGNGAVNIADLSIFLKLIKI